MLICDHCTHFYNRQLSVLLTNFNSLSFSPSSSLSLSPSLSLCYAIRSETDSLQSHNRIARIFCVRVQMKNEACLVEATPSDQSLSTQLRSRGCYLVQQVKENRLFLWYGAKCTKSLRKSAIVAARRMKNR